MAKHDYVQLTEKEFDSITAWKEPVPYFMEPYRWTRSGTLAGRAIEVTFLFDEDDEEDAEFSFQNSAGASIT